MNETILMVLGVTLGILTVMFILTFVAITLIKKKHKRDRFNSLPSGGSDGSEYSEMLIEKYRNQKIEKEL